jgi:hypothetical protein
MMSPGNERLAKTLSVPAGVTSEHGQNDYPRFGFAFCTENYLRSGDRSMSRILIVLCLIFGVGCSPASDTDTAVSQSSPQDVDGGTVENADRDKAQEFLGALGKVQSVEEEEKLLTEFAEWLKKKEYRIGVDAKNEKHVLSCPYFPPVTPWTEHSFLDVRNLELLPRLDNGG